MSEDANFQDISVHDKDHASLGPTQEAQDVSRLNKIVVPPGAFTDPGNPGAASGSLNLSVNTHPMELSADYGADVNPGEDDVRKPADTHALDMLPVQTGAEAAVEYPEDRAEWQKKHWQAKSAEYGLAVSGNIDTVKTRVEDYEATVEEAKDFSAEEWKDQIAQADNLTELEDLQSVYVASGADYSTVEDAFAARASELSNEQST